MISYAAVLTSVTRLTTAPAVTDAEIRSWLTGMQTEAENRAQQAINTTPPAAQATIAFNRWRLDIDGGEPGVWFVYSRLWNTLTVSDVTSEDTAVGYLDSYYPPMQGWTRSAVATATPTAQARIQSWHLHRTAGPIDEIEPARRRP